MGGQDRCARARNNRPSVDMRESAERRGTRAVSGVQDLARVCRPASYNKPNAGVWRGERASCSGSFSRLLTQEQRQSNCAEFSVSFLSYVLFHSFCYV